MQEIIKTCFSWFCPTLYYQQHACGASRDPDDNRSFIPPRQRQQTAVQHVEPEEGHEAPRSLDRSIHLLYRVIHTIRYMGWLDIELVGYPGWWATIVATYCPSRLVQHPKSMSTQPMYLIVWITL